MAEGIDARRPFTGTLGPLLVVLVAVLVVLSGIASGEGVLVGDVRFQRFVQRAPEPFFRWVADFGNWVGSARTGAAIATLLVVALLIRKQPYSASLLLIAYVARTLNGVLKALFESPRPPAHLVRVDELADGLGFPSGHAMGSTLLFGAIALVATRVMNPGIPQRTVQALSVFTLLLVGFGRVFVGAHWPSDVLGGYLFGILILMGITTVHSAFWRRLPESRHLLR